MLKAVLFGAIGTLAETSDLQRRAFNRAFAEAELDWQWDRDVYRELLEVSGGKNRIRHYSDQTDPEGSELTEERVVHLHKRKTEIYNATLAEKALEPRPGVARLIGEAKAQGIKLGLASGTSRDNIEAITNAAGLNLSDFGAVMNRSKISEGKPAADVYETCLRDLGVDASQAVAIEDTTISVQAAKNAGLVCVATPGEYTNDQDFSAADAVVESLGEAGSPVTVIRTPIDLNGAVTLDWLETLLKHRQ